MAINVCESCRVPVKEFVDHYILGYGWRCGPCYRMWALNHFDDRDQFGTNPENWA